MFETVHTVADYYDGPRGGLADCGGQVHYYEAEWSSGDGDYAETFLLTPIDSDVLSIALEDWAIWRRWEQAFHSGQVEQASRPALPEERERHEELQRLLSGKLETESKLAVRKCGEFRTREDCRSWPAGVLRDLEVRWYDPA